MSASTLERADDRGIELGSAVSWPHIYAAVGIGTFALLAIVLLTIFVAIRPAPRDDLSVANAVARPAKLMPFAALRSEEPKKPVAEEAAAKPIPQAALPKQDKAEPPKPPAKNITIAAQRPPAPVRVETRKPPQVETAPEPPLHLFKRLDPLTEEELREWLAKTARDLDIETEKGTTAKLLADAKKAPKPATGATGGAGGKDPSKQPAQPVPLMELVAQRADLKGLPMRDAAKCQVSAKEALVMLKMSMTVRRFALDRSRADNDSALSYGQRHYRDMEMVRFLKDKLTSAEMREDAGPRIAMQMLQADGGVVQAEIFKLLAADKGKAAGGEIIAQRAVFDLRPEVRQAAVEALKERPAGQARSVLLAALRYPWPPVADHAAEALVALGDREAVFDLVSLLDQPDTAAPTQDKHKKWAAHQLARVNHLGNCVLCHAPSTGKEDSVRGVIPERGKALPQAYYEGSTGNFVRADITYLKQDFSLMETVSEPNKWPKRQRFDYLVRHRELSADEVARLPATSTPSSYPQREAVLWALRELTGQDMGGRSEVWQEFLTEQWLAQTRQE